MKKIKYLEYYEDKLVFLSFNERNYPKNSELHSLPNELQFINYEDNLFHIEINNRTFYLYIKNLTPSGIESNWKKRVQVSANNSLKDKNAIALLIYYAGKGKYCFIKIEPNEILQYNGDSNKSIWVDFECIYHCIKNNQDFYITKHDHIHDKNYRQYFSMSIEKLLLNSENFDVISQDILNDIKFEILEKIQNNSKNKLPFLNKLFQFQEKEIENMKTLTNEDKQIGIYAEKIFNHLLINNPNYIEKILSIKLKNHVWKNEKGESYEPYDFQINENIYIDVKGTKNDSPKFSFSNSEKSFRENLRKYNNLYFIINIYDIANCNSNWKLKIYSSDDLDELSYNIKSTYSYYGD